MGPLAFRPHSLERSNQRMTTQAEKAKAFRALHERDSAFIIPNPWDAGTARILAHLGFEALATTSMGYALSLGRRDNTLNRAESRTECREPCGVNSIFGERGPT